MSETELMGKEFVGYILPDKDPSHQGKYKVNIPEFQPHTKDSEGILAKNQVHKYRVSPSAYGVCGSYYPLQPGMAVMIKFSTNQIESAFIDRIVADQQKQSLPFQIIERDDFYQIIRTPKNNNLIAIFEGSSDSTNIPKNSIHICYNNNKTVVVIDEKGIHIITANTVDIKSAEKINLESVGDINIKSSGKINLEAAGEINIKSSSTIKTQAAADIGIKAGGNNYIESSNNHLKGNNIGIVPAGSASTAPTAGIVDPIVDPPMVAFNDYPAFNKSKGG